MIRLLATILLVSGAATAYGEPEHLGQPLYCDTRSTLIFGRVYTPFVAVDVSEYQSGRIQCGDWIRIYFPDGQVLDAQALDAGYLYRYRVDQWDAPIVVDVPFQFAPFAGLSAPATAINLSAFHRLAAEVIPE